MIRNSKPTLDKTKAKEAILYILSKGSFSLSDLKTILYFIDFNSYELNEEAMLGFTYKKEITS